MAVMNWNEEYSEEFDTYRKNRIRTSFYKYGSAKINYGEKLVEALPSADLCIRKYKQTGNTEYLLDAANYLMFEFMYPPAGSYFAPTDSSGSAGQVGMSINRMMEEADK